MRDGTFLQSTTWESFVRQIGHQTHRIDDVLIVERETPVGHYWYVGRAEIDSAQIDTIVGQAKQAGILFVRIDPLSGIENRQGNHSPFTIHHSPSTQPQTTLVLDLEPAAEELLKSFREKTRYNIRLAERKGVTIEESADAQSKATDDFLVLMAKTGSRQGIRSQTERYYRTMLEVLNSRKRVPLFGERGVRGDLRRNEIPLNPPLAKGGSDTVSASIVVARSSDGSPLAANLMLWTNDTAYYLHGASDHSARKLMAPHLLQWACIQRAKERGATAYDFWGIAPLASSPQLLASRNLRSNRGLPPESSKLKSESYEADASHPWSGITRFKLGFGGQIIQYPQSVDLVLDPLRYRLYQGGRAIRRAFGRVV